MQRSGGALLVVGCTATTPSRRMVLITIHRKPLESPAVFVFSRAKFSLDFHVYKMSAVGIRTLDGILCVEITATWEGSST
jgi:hypothetical protein